MCDSFHSYAYVLNLNRLSVDRPLENYLKIEVSEMSVHIGNTGQQALPTTTWRTPPQTSLRVTPVTGCGPTLHTAFPMGLNFA